MTREELEALAEKYATKTATTYIGGFQQGKSSEVLDYDEKDAFIAGALAMREAAVEIAFKMYQYTGVNVGEPHEFQMYLYLQKIKELGESK